VYIYKTFIWHLPTGESSAKRRETGDLQRDWRATSLHLFSLALEEDSFLRNSSTEPPSSKFLGLLPINEPWF